MISDQQQPVQVSLLEPELPGVGSTARVRGGGLRNPHEWVPLS
jgi:hypothetical protein